jgi:thiol-disulfide isomerase/thioredoxin
MKTRTARYGIAFALVVALAASIAVAGCSSSGSGGSGGSGKPTLISFIGSGSTSAESMKPIVEKLKAQFAGNVTFVDVNYSPQDPTVKKYKVTMNPTFIILNTDGQVKETFMGAADEQMLSSALQSFVPGASKATSTPGGVQVPGSAVQTIPVTPGTGPQ